MYILALTANIEPFAAQITYFICPSSTTASMMLVWNMYFAPDFSTISSYISLSVSTGIELGRSACSVRETQP